MSLPAYNAINIETIPQQLEKLLENNKQSINELLKNQSFNWQTLMQPMESLDDQLHHFWSPVSHLQSVMETETLREKYQACLAPLTQYSSELAHNKKLFEAVQSIADSAEFDSLSLAQQKTIKNQLRDFKLAGVALSDDDKKKFVELSQSLSELCNKFSNHVLDATHGWNYHTEDKNELTGLPEHALLAAQQAAKDDNKTGYLFTLDAPVYIAIMTHANNRELREKFYQAYVTRASDQGPCAGQWDNSEIMHEILQTRSELAQLLGFKTYAHYSLATKMVDNSQQVLDFLHHLVDQAHTKAKKEMLELQTFAKSIGFEEKLQPWDISYYSEKMREAKYDISQEQLRPYFPLPHVLQGLFAILKKLYGITVEANDELETWHPDVKVFTLFDQQHKPIAYCYMDFYARQHKRGGAWMDECQIRRTLDDQSLQLPAAYLTCNFQAPVGDAPALLTHNDVVTLFHEFGHCLQHMLTKMSIADVSGINGVPWDAVELPSQFMENWAWQKQGLDLIAQHYKTGEPLPQDLFDKMLAAKNFHAAMGLVRQLEFALFDFRLHLEFDSNKKNQIQQVIDEVRAQVSVTPAVDYNRFQHGFSHIFAGGYAAGYYSYLWAEVMAADAFSLFEQNGIFHTDTATHFKQCILETGGSEEPLELFTRFRGREPQVDALLKQNGIIA
ncbi:MAG: M3 family metallopeptidase [Coxiellaceae bacterium]|nr:M3 family metallopeptidase [Coxiellaceae bacterium]